jgi:dTDP-4-amino-4,6-dideoxygalactose transaminase
MSDDTEAAMMKEPGMIPFVDLVTPHEELQEELLHVFRTALQYGRFSGGPMVEQFEADFGAFCGTAHCVGVASGTDALRFALLAAGIQRGDAVITTPHTFLATAEAITQAGAWPEFADIDEQSGNLDPHKLAVFLNACRIDAATGRAISRRSGRRITGIVPVHLYGQMADMDPMLALARRFNLKVVEDACQAHGAAYFSRQDNCWKQAGSMGDAAAFSFYPSKNLGACGEAGAVTTNDETIAAKVRMLRDHGQSQKYMHAIEGYNGRLDAIQAGILSVKLRHLPMWTEQRRERATRYRQLLQAIPEIMLPEEMPYGKAVYHLYVVRVQNRDELQHDLTQAGIDTGVHYPTPLHLQKAYAWLGYVPGDFPAAERAAAEVLSLPMYPQLTCEQQDRVIYALRCHFHHSGNVQGLERYHRERLIT